MRIDGLTIGFPTDGQLLRAVDDLSVEIGPGELVGIVGESGSGKSVMGLAMLGLIQRPGERVGGSVTWGDEDLFDSQVASRVRGREISMVFQDPMVSLNPLKSVGRQLREVLTRRAGHSRAAADRRAVELLEQVGISFPRQRMKQLPHEFSGGMRQRVMIAAALAGDPTLIIADEPTTGLDVTIQEQILDLFRRLSAELGLAVVMITHDLGVVAEFCERAAVMYAGRIVERATVTDLFGRPSHPYTRALLESMPRLDGPRGPLVAVPGDPLDRVRLPRGCAFAPRCAEAMELCDRHLPVLQSIVPDAAVACHARHQGGAAR